MDSHLSQASADHTRAARSSLVSAESDTTRALHREVRQLNVPWEREYGYAQAVRVGKVADFRNMEAQMRQSYANAAHLLEQFGASLANVVEETLYVLDVDAAFAVAGVVRKELYGASVPPVASNLIGTPRLAFRELLIEIRMTAMLP